MLRAQANRRGTVLVATVGAVVLAAAPLTPAGAADDVTKPALHTPKEASFLVGSAIGPMLPNGDGEVISTSDIPMYATWRATDESGICEYKVRQFTYGFDTPWRDVPSISAARYDWLDDDYVDQEGGGSYDVPGYSVRAYDCAGNARTKYVDGGPIVWQDTGESYGFGELAITYSDGWAVSSCGCWSGGTTHRTSQAGASATFELESGKIALVMEQSPDRGEFELWVDRALRRTVDTSADTKQHRTIVWTGRLKGAGPHTVEIVNLATPGRPRIDLDAVLTH